MKVGIVGSRRYENKRKIKEFIFKLKNEYGTDTIIVSGGCKDGADKYAKKYALELGLQYEEYPPFHEVHNLYCTMPESRYGKPFSMKNFFARNKIVHGTMQPSMIDVSTSMQHPKFGLVLCAKSVCLYATLFSNDIDDDNIFGL